MSWLPKDRVVVPVDYSDESLAAVDVARSLVKDDGHLYVIHVLAPVPSNNPELFWETETQEDRRVNCESALRERFAKNGESEVHVRASVGDPGSEIAEYAEEIRADLIVLPSHGRTGLSRILIGSVAERVCRLAHCPVLVLRD
ncbi:MAG: universal stress protein [Planctomycetota bacterium]|nr:MAG: universal stress protein [Planctomycetota bacterium]REJ96483.1 MAG: universal stress protein [Planctomycetota bacterium]REK25127.1 MAG: universal stress protein [Planctomycetota bacterium]REK40519.1 MAG: universal stress protein [Planctomycetota bacterium]